MKIKDITDYLELIAPKALQESYDNCGLLTGDMNDEATGALLTLDCTEAVVDEAIHKNHNLIISHHPIIFGGLKQLTGKTYIERTIIKAIRNNISIYAIHTNLDNILHGVNARIADQLHLTNRAVLLPKPGQLLKLVSFVPSDQAETVLHALYKAGAGNIGNYSNCSFKVDGTGSFTPNDGANPTIGKKNEATQVIESRIEILFPADLKNDIITALNQSHPYEEVAYYITRLENNNAEIGSGLIGTLEKEYSGEDFLEFLKEKMTLNCIRHTKLLNQTISRVALCGGSGSFLLKQAKSLNADVFITADFKYHDFFDAENKILICDIGHYESEVYTKDLLYELLSKKLANFAVNLSEIVTNPINYYK